MAFITVQVRRYVLAAVREMETRRERDQMQGDLEVASEIQRGLLPGTMPELAGYEIAAFSRPAESVRGEQSNTIGAAVPRSAWCGGRGILRRGETAGRHDSHRHSKECGY